MQRPQGAADLLIVILSEAKDLCPLLT